MVFKHRLSGEGLLTPRACGAMIGFSGFYGKDRSGTHKATRNDEVACSPTLSAVDRFPKVSPHSKSFEDAGMPCQTWWKVAILGCLCSGFAATTQAADCSGDYYYDEVDCSGAGPAVYRPNIRIVVRRPRISLGGFAPAAPPQSYVTQPQQAATSSGAVSAGFPVFMMAAPAMSFGGFAPAPNPGSVGSGATGAAASSGLTDEEIRRICRICREMEGASGATGAVGNGPRCGSNGAVGAGAAGGNSTCDEIRQLRKDVDGLIDNMQGLTRSVNELVNRLEKKADRP